LGFNFNLKKKEIEEIKRESERKENKLSKSPPPFVPPLTCRWRKYFSPLLFLTRKLNEKKRKFFYNSERNKFGDIFFLSGFHIVFLFKL